MDFASCVQAELARLSGAEILLVTNLGRTCYLSPLTYSVFLPDVKAVRKIDSRKSKNYLKVLYFCLLSSLFFFSEECCKIGFLLIFSAVANAE